MKSKVAVNNTPTNNKVMAIIQYLACQLVGAPYRGPEKKQKKLLLYRISHTATVTVSVKVNRVQYGKQD